ncbi:EAL domain-containing protein [Rhodoferax ferrireducens]|uniref:EAL domain-containing protein n=1 Tax=Rhodoferax ferrireducens TaxID=192843 RepID=UPI000E0D6B8E|nr:EAL domain-containing protein [Rhodoferax ferrireducens]
MKNLSNEAVAALARAIGIDAQEITQRKAFLKFDETDVNLLTELHARLHDVSQHFVDDFYTHLIKFEETRRFVPDSPSLERLKRSQATYFDSLTAGDYGPEYVLQRLRVGVVHQRIGLEPKWYLGAYSKYLVGLLPELWRLLGDDPEKFLATYHALQKIVFLDIGFALDTYMQAGRHTILGLKRYAENIIASLPAGLIVVNDTLKVRSINRSFREMFGLKNGEDVCGRELEDILPLPDLRQQAQAVLASGMALRGIDVALGEKWLRLTITGIRLAEEEEEEEEEEELLVVVEDITELKVQAAHIEQLAFYDHLTGLPNRRLLHDRLQQALSLGTRNHLYGAVLMLDLDNFKRINDTRGHDVGDRLLVETALRIQSCVRQADTVARLGGDEFIVVLVDLSADEAQAALQAEGVGKKILAAINQPCMLANQLHHSSASMGLCLFLGQNATLDELLKRADSAMYQAKSSGRNTLRFYDPQIQASLETRISLESELRNALAGSQLKLYYQIQIDNTQGVLGAEVLLRWQHPQRGLVLPDQFIPIAEETGLILPIGEWVLRTACEQLKVWATDPVTEKFVLAVNVSARQFRQSDFVSMVCQILAQTGINPEKLKLELTESLVLHNVVDTIAKMKALNQQGIHFSMDDFGTGYSSLSQLTLLPIQQLKIDKSFVSNIDTNHNDAIVVQTIIGMANNLGLRVIAEGVETQEQRACLERFGCQTYQGYLFGRPVPLREFEKLAMQGITA